MNLIPGLRQSQVFEMSSDLYRRHHDPRGGPCPRCGQPSPCPTRQHAASVILAAGDDPGQYDEWHDGEDSGPTHIGYSLGGRGRALPPEGFTYERDTS